MAIVSDAIGIAYHSHLTTVYDHYYGDKGMAENTVSFKVTIDQLLGMPNLMNCITADKGVTEEDVRHQLQQWKDEGLEYVPEQKQG